MSKENNVVEVFNNHPDFTIHVNFVKDSESFIFVDSFDEEKNAIHVPFDGLHELKDAIEVAIRYRENLLKNIGCGNPAGIPQEDAENLQEAAE